MKHRQFNLRRSFFLVFDGGDDVLDVIRRLARELGIRGAHFAAIGALQRCVVAYWNRDLREYEHIAVGEQVEVLSLIGDVAMEGDDIKIHAHIVLGRRDGSTVGGHLIEGTVFPTLEMHLSDFAGALERRADEETRLSLIAIAEER